MGQKTGAAGLKSEHFSGSGDFMNGARFERVTPLVNSLASIDAAIRSVRDLVDDPGGPNVPSFERLHRSPGSL